MRKAVNLCMLLGADAVAGCVQEDTAGVAEPQASRGAVVTSLGSFYTEAPILYEGSGKIGIGTKQQNANGTIYRRHSLVDSADKPIARVEHDWTLGTAPMKGDTVQGFVDRLRCAGRLTTSGQWARGAQDEGFQVATGLVDTTNNQRAVRGCRTHHPDLLAQWQ